jgi:hypothetical protein
MRELGRRSGEARRRRREQQLEPLTDREQAMAALRRALDGNNRAAMVAAAKALLEFDRSDPRAALSSSGAPTRIRHQFDASHPSARSLSRFRQNATATDFELSMVAPPVWISQPALHGASFRVGVGPR